MHLNYKIHKNYLNYFILFLVLVYKNNLKWVLMV